MNKNRIAEIFDEIATLLELRGENPFKSRAFSNAARVVSGIAEDLQPLIDSGEIRNYKGIGESIAKEIAALLSTGKSPAHEDLKKDFPPGVIEMLRIPGLGPKKVKAVYEKLGISTVGELEYACHENRLSHLAGFGEKTQENILRGIQFTKKNQERRLYDYSFDEASRLLSTLSRHPKIDRLELGGSLRRKRETIKDIDILTSAKEKDRETIMDFFVTLPEVEAVVGKGDTKASVVLKSGMNADLRIVNDDEFAFALLYFTGSKEHNVAMRGRAQKMGYKLNEYGLLKGNRPTPCKTEEEIFKKLGLDYIPPELREDMGELEAAETGALPRLVETADIRGIFHNHTTYSDGAGTIEAMSLKAKKLGYEYIGISDHSKTAVYANGMKEDAIKKQFKEIDELNKKLKGITIFKGVECDILPDGRMDYSDKILASFDFVIASVHSNFKMTEEEMTNRIIKALSNPHVTMLGHATGRLLLTREPYPVNMHRVIDAAAKLKKIVEINAHPQRLDLDWRLVKYAKQKGVKISINPDAHSPDGEEVVPYGVGIARKGWLEKEDVINTMGKEKIRQYLNH